MYVHKYAYVDVLVLMIKTSLMSTAIPSLLGRTPLYAQKSY